MSLNQAQTEPGIYEPSTLPAFDLRQAWVSTGGWDGTPRLSLEGVDSTLYSVQDLSIRGRLRGTLTSELQLEEVMVGSWIGGLRSRDNRFMHILEAIDKIDRSLQSLPRDREELLTLSERMRSRIAEIRLKDGHDTVRSLGSFVSTRSDVWAQVHTRRNGENHDDLFLAKLRGLIPLVQKGAVKAKPVVAGKDGKLGVANGVRLLYVELPRKDIE
jgi:hypothetical protein